MQFHDVAFGARNAGFRARQHDRRNREEARRLTTWSNLAGSLKSESLPITDATSSIGSRRFFCRNEIPVTPAARIPQEPRENRSAGSRDHREFFENRVRDSLLSSATQSKAR